MAILSLVFVFPLYFFLFTLKGEEYFFPAHSLSRIWGKYLMAIWFSYPQIEGLELIDPKKTYVIVSNHNSQSDIPLAAISTKNGFKFLAKEELTKIPLLGKIIEKMYLTVARKSMRDKAMAMIKMRNCLQSGISVWVFPEGTRNLTNLPLAEINDGAFRLAADYGFELAVCKMSGTKRLLPAKSFLFSPSKITVRWSKPIQSKNIDELRAWFVSEIERV